MPHFRVCACPSVLTPASRLPLALATLAGMAMLSSVAQAEDAVNAAIAPGAAAPVAKPPAVPPATGGKPDWFGLSAVFAAGYDSNVLLEPDSNANATGKDSAALTADLKATFRLYRDQALGRKASLAIDGAYNRYPSAQEGDLGRFGATITGGWRLAGIDPGVAIGVHRYWLDGGSAADAAGIATWVAKTYTKNVAILALAANHLSYEDNAQRDGWMLSAEYRHWFLPTARVVNRRIEAGVRGTDYAAVVARETYLAATPFVGAFWRAGDKLALGTIDYAARAQYEFRAYNAVEHQRIANLTASADAWLCTNASAGAYVAYTKRDSNVDVNDYKRWQLGVRAGMAW